LRSCCVPLSDWRNKNKLQITSHRPTRTLPNRRILRPRRRPPSRNPPPHLPRKTSRHQQKRIRPRRSRKRRLPARHTRKPPNPPFLRSLVRRTRRSGQGRNPSQLRIPRPRETLLANLAKSWSETVERRMGRFGCRPVVVRSRKFTIAKTLRSCWRRPAKT